MQIFLKMDSGISYLIEAEPADTVLELKKKIEKQHNFPSAEQRLAVRGIPLNDSDQLVTHGLVNGSTIRLEVKSVLENEKALSLTNELNKVLEKIKEAKQEFGYDFIKKIKISSENLVTTEDIISQSKTKGYAPTMY